MLDIMEKTKIEFDLKDSYGKFIIEPLEQGYGITLGNSLRRVLLSSIPGAAITFIKIDGVLHEFSVIPGVIEDVTEIILNLKKIRLKLYTDKPKTLNLQVKGEREVKASDISSDPEVEILNPDLHIAALNDKSSKLSIEFIVEKGKGYILADKHKTDQAVIGLIPIDSIFTPIRKVNYMIENTRVGYISDYDRLILEIWTDGSISPIDALNYSAELLQSCFKLFTDLRLIASGEIAPTEQSLILEKSIEELGFSIRSLNCLRRAAVKNLGELVQFGIEDLMKLKNFGQKSLDEIHEKLKEFNLCLKESSN
ncbi:MAG: DNA-directed RNA polymerase subunit alpha [Armatimonadetes bacterium]|nr:DNA-directed RNA polymerase subunit alpha [Armatimonadota bacterium]